MRVRGDALGRIILAGSLIGCLAASRAHAEEPISIDGVTAQDDTATQYPQNPPIYGRDPLTKAGRGVTNVITAWLEWPRRMSDSCRAPKPAQAFADALWSGSKAVALRLALGVYETATFPIPYPKEYEPPYARWGLREYAWE